MFYQLYEWNHAALQPARAFADAGKLFYESPLNPLSRTSFGRSMAASFELFERTTRRYAKPAFDLPVNAAKIETFGRSKALVIERFDRRRTTDGR